MPDKEPTYVFRKGDGWVPVFTGNILTPEDCKGEWVTIGTYYNVYYYPKVCETYRYFKGLEHTALKVGDVIPYDYNVRVIKKIVSMGKDRAVLIVDHLFNNNERFHRFGLMFTAYGHYQGVVRPDAL